VALDVECRGRETNRDRDRRVFTFMMQDGVGMCSLLCSAYFANVYIDEELEEVIGKKFHYAKWLKTGWTHHLCIHDWPDKVAPPGPGFNLKSLGSNALSLLVGGFIENLKNNNTDKPYPYIASWSDGA